MIGVKYKKHSQSGTAYVTKIIHLKSQLTNFLSTRDDQLDYPVRFIWLIHSIFMIWRGEQVRNNAINGL